MYSPNRQIEGQTDRTEIITYPHTRMVMKFLGTSVSHVTAETDRETDRDPTENITYPQTRMVI